LNDRSDETKVRAGRRHDKAAYALLVKRHYRHVFALCLGVLGNVHDAEDLAQDAMLRGLSEIKKLRKAEHFEAWILRIAKNLCIDFIRRQKRVRLGTAQHLVQPRHRVNENHDLHQAIRQLPLELRVPLVMYYFDERNAKSIAQRLNISHSGACQRIKRARKDLHTLLTERDHNE